MTEPNDRATLPVLTEQERALRHRIEHDFESVTPEEYDQFILSRGRDQLAIACATRLQEQLDSSRSFTGLEVGFGTGIISKRLAKIDNLELFGLERRQDFIDFAIEHGRIAKDHVRVGNFNDIPFEDGQFDVFTGVGVLNQRDDPTHFYREAKRVLRPGGLVFLPWVKPKADSVQREMQYMQDAGLYIIQQESDLLIGRV